MIITEYFRVSFRLYGILWGCIGVFRVVWICIGCFGVLEKIMINKKCNGYYRIEKRDNKKLKKS